MMNPGNSWIAMHAVLAGAFTACSRPRHCAKDTGLPTPGAIRAQARRFLLSALFLFILALSQSALAASVTLVLSDASPPYQQFANAFLASVRNESIQVSTLDLEQAARAVPAGTQLIIAVGSQAAEVMEAHPSSGPLALAMIPRATYDRVRNKRAVIGGVLIDQPPARYIQLVRIALPDHTMIGLLAGRDSKESTQRLLSAAREQGIKAQSETILDEQDIYPAMQRLLSDGAVLLATPDNTIFNSRTIPSILLSAFRRQVPVIGFSPAYVNAGATVALYSSPEQLAAQTAELARSVLNGSGNPGMQYPRQFTVGINERVARSLGLHIDDSAVAIRERLEKLERQP